MVWSEMVAVMKQYQFIKVVVKPIADERPPQYAEPKDSEINTSGE